MICKEEIKKTENAMSPPTQPLINSLLKEEKVQHGGVNTNNLTGGMEFQPSLSYIVRQMERRDRGRRRGMKRGPNEGKGSRERREWKGRDGGRETRVFPS